MQPSADQLIQTNLNVRNYLVRNCPSIPLKIGTFTSTQQPYVAGLPTVINVPLRPTGLLKKLIVEVTANIAQGAAETQTRQPFGPAAFFSNINFTDLENVQRHNSTGIHFHNVASAKRQLPFGASYTTDNPTGMGSNYGLISAPATLTTVQPMRMYYEVPISYTDTDLRGAIMSNTLFGVMNLQLTINPNFFAAAGADATASAYKSSTAQLGVISAYTINVYQVYLDQLPQDQSGGYVVPAIDTATYYKLQSTTASGSLAVGQDQSLPFAALLSYMSAFVIYDNGGVLNAGTDLNYIKMVTANAAELFNLNPYMLQLLNGRLLLGDDWPVGCYYLNFRDRPVSTTTYGNTTLNINPSVVNANALLNIGYEYFQMSTQQNVAGSNLSS